MELSSPNAKLDAISPEEALQAFTSDPDLERLETLLAEFNLFDVLGITRSELQHSRVIAWLLNPRGSHGLSDYFLRGFLSQAATMAKEREIKCVAFTPEDVDGWKFGNIKVAPERHKIDILLIDGSNGFVCPIENKVGSGEHSDQLSRYLQTVESEYGDLTPFPIYLTPDGRKPEKKRDAERWIPFGYEIVADLLKQTLDRCGLTISADVSSFLKQYERTIRRRVLDTPSDIDKLALQIYNDHRQAIDHIIKVKPINMLWPIVETVVERHAPDFRNHSSDNIHLYFTSPRLDFHIDENKPEPMFRFDFLHHQESLRLRLMVARDSETRNRLFQMDPPTDYDHRKRNPDQQEFRMYWKEVLSRHECNPSNPDMKPRLGKAVQEFYDNDYWPLVNAIREEFGQPSISPS